MTSDRYTLAKARAIIDAESPEVADVAAQLLATVERVQALADEWAGHWCSRECVGPKPERIELLAAINGEEETE